MSQVTRNIAAIFRCGGQYRNQQLEPMGLSARQASFLLEICETPGISQDTLARRLFLNKSVIARQLATLEEEGFVERIPCQKDKRIVRLHPTGKTRELLPRIRAVWTDWEEYLTRDMTQTEVEALEGLLGRLKARAAEWMEAD